MKSGKLISAIALLVALAMPVSLAAQEHPTKHHRYNITDLGTLGGPESYFGFVAQVLNSKGTFVGASDLNKLDPYFPNCANPRACYAGHAARWDNGTLTDLGALPKGASSSAAWINTNGVAIGSSQNGVIDPLTGLPEGQAVRWDKAGHIHPLGTLGGNESFATAVNDNDWVVGAAANAIPDSHSLFGWGTQTRAFLWKSTTGMKDLGTLPGGTDAFAGNVNQSGQIAGTSYTNSTGSTEPFLWENGTMTGLGTLGGTVGGENYLNNKGQVVGQSNLANGTTHAFFWDKSTGMTDMGTLGGNYANALDLNDAGEVVGVSALATYPLYHAFLWKAGAMTDLGTVKGDTCSEAWAINSQGQVVGESRPHCGIAVHAFLWENGGPMVDLNTLVPPYSQIQLIYAAAINDRGQIACLGLYVLGVTATDFEHVFLLTPVAEDDVEHPTVAPEPSVTPRLPTELVNRYHFAGAAAWRPID